MAIDHLGTKELKWKEKAANYILRLPYRKFIALSLIERLEKERHWSSLSCTSTGQGEIMYNIAYKHHVTAAAKNILNLLH